MLLLPRTISPSLLVIRLLSLLVISLRLTRLLSPLHLLPVMMRLLLARTTTVAAMLATRITEVVVVDVVTVSPNLLRVKQE